MKINFDTVLKGLDGAALKFATSVEETRDMTLKDASISGLTSHVAGDEHTSGEDKFKRYQLAQKVYAGGEVELTPEESSLIKQRIGKCYGPVVVGPAFVALNG